MSKRGDYDPGALFPPFRVRVEARPYHIADKQQVQAVHSQLALPTGCHMDDVTATNTKLFF